MQQQPASSRILVVDDDMTVRDVVCRYLELAGYEVNVGGTGEEALTSFTAQPPDLVVLDIMLPGISGLEVCRRLRRDSRVPIVMLTALGEEEDRVIGLQLGADDYIAKPFSPRELVLRVSSVLRRAQATPVPRAAPVIDGDLRLDPVAHKATLGDTELTLTAREFDLLLFLVTDPGTVYTREQLLEQVWGWNFGDRSTVTVHVRRLREKVERDPAKPKRIVTVWGIGYRYDAVEPA
jgi:DNA-binding response OmpR family regulator